MQHELSGTGERIDLATWERSRLFQLFSRFDEPYHGVCVRVDCTESFRYAKANAHSVFLTLLHRSLVAANHVENFKTRIVDGEPWRFETIHGGSAVGRANGTIGFGYYPFYPSLPEFVAHAAREVERVKQRDDLERQSAMNLIRYSVLPWLDFTSVSHARDFSRKDSAPFITFGKITEANGRRTMPVSLHVHHALADGSHVGLFVEKFETCLANPELT